MGRKKIQKNKIWCPMEGTNYEGYCVENFATISVKKKSCDHFDYCIKIKDELESKKQNENTALA